MTRSITREARLYALRELLRRAGVAELADWRVSVAEAEVRLELAGRAVAFPIRETASLVARVVGLEDGTLAVPFQAEAPPAGAPLFAVTEPGRLACVCDLLASVVLTLSRAEELGDADRDQHGRFPGAASVGAIHGFLDRPIVDDCAVVLRQALLRLWPNWQPRVTPPRVKFSQDIDLVGLPFSPRQAAGHWLRRRNARAALADCSSAVTDREPAYLKSARDVAEEALRRGIVPALYWKAAEPGTFDSGYDPLHPKVRRVMQWARERGCELGVHPAYDTFRNREALRAEVERLLHATGQQEMGGRQHFLRWWPGTWADWEACGLSYDSTVGFSDLPGFRAGTCHPYRPWLIAENREADLLEIPLVLMEGTLFDYMRLPLTECFAVFDTLLRRCEAVGGVFTLLWHNSTSVDRRLAPLLPLLLDRLANTPDYDWRDDLLRLRQPGAW